MFKEIVQVAFVTENLEETLHNFTNIYQTGPWYVLDFSPENVNAMQIHGKKKYHSMRVGVRNIGDIRFEYIEPLTPSIYTEFLKQYSDRIVHHVKFDVDNYKQALDFFKSKNIDVLQSGHQLGDKGKNMYYFMDTIEKLSFIAEIVNVTGDFIKPEPDFWYPEKDKDFDFIFKGVSQIGIVTKDVLKKINDFEEFGIGPWEITEFNKDNISNMEISGKKKNYNIKVAFCKLGNMQFKLIQPLGSSIFMDHLNSYGETIHHLKMEVDDYDKTLDYLQSKGVNILQSGKLNGKINFSYLDTGKHINFSTEISEKKIGNQDSLVFHP